MSQEQKTRRERYAQLDRECTSLKEQISAKRRELVQKNKERARFAPVYALPDDIWFEILELAFVHRFPYCRKEDFTLSDSPVSFSHVSRRFQEVTLALPSIWACVHVNPYQSTFYHKMLQKQLRRSRAAPISITFLCSSTNEDISKELNSDKLFGRYSRHFKTCWRLLVSHKERWRHLSFWAQNGGIIAALLDNSKVLSTPQLEYVDICLRDNGLCRHRVDSVFEASVLSSMRLHAVMVPPIVTSTFSSLTTLSLVDLSAKWTELRTILDLTASTLTTLVLKEYHRGDPDAASNPCFLPHLRHLVLFDILLAGEYAVFFSRSAPNISKLEIQGSDLYKILDYTMEPEGVRVVYPAVKHLIIDPWEDTESYEVGSPDSRLFDPFPAVEHISIVWDYDEEQTTYLQSLLEPSETDLHADETLVHLPYLKRLSLAGLPAPDDLVRLVACKAKVQHPFETIVLDRALESRAVESRIAELLEEHGSAVEFGDVAGPWVLNEWDSFNDSPILQHWLLS